MVRRELFTVMPASSRRHRIGPEKGVIHIALGAVNNALWDMYARSRNKHLWKLVVDMTPVRPFTTSRTQKPVLMIF